MSSRKKKQKLKAPPLTAVDKTIYFAVIVSAYIVLYLISHHISSVRTEAAMSIPNTVAYHRHITSILSAPFVILLFLIITCFIGYAFSNSIPIIGNRSIKYGPPKYKNTYPLFGSQHQKNQISDKEKLFLKRLFTTITILLFIFVALCFLSIRARTIVLADGSIKVIGPTGNIKASYRSSQAVSCEIDTYSPGINGSMTSLFTMKLIMHDGRKVTLMPGDFINGGTSNMSEILKAFIVMKEDANNAIITISEHTDRERLYSVLDEEQKTLADLLLTN